MLFFGGEKPVYLGIRASQLSSPLPVKSVHKPYASKTEDLAKNAQAPRHRAPSSYLRVTQVTEDSIPSRTSGVLLARPCHGRGFSLIQDLLFQPGQYLRRLLNLTPFEKKGAISQCPQLSFQALIPDRGWSLTVTSLRETGAVNHPHARPSFPSLIPTCMLLYCPGAKPSSSPSPSGPLALQTELQPEASGPVPCTSMGRIKSQFFCRQEIVSNLPFD